MNLLLVNEKVARLAREVGFNESCDWIYSPYHKLEKVENKINRNYLYAATVPTQALLQQWLREVHEIHVQPIKTNVEDKFSVGRIFLGDEAVKSDHKKVKSYERVMNNALYLALQIIKENGKTN